jgi:hypothetical protein
MCVLGYPQPGDTIYAIIGQQIPPSRIDQAIANPDALQVAYNVGVLELLSLGLTLFAILLALVAVFGYWTIRGAAKRAASETAKTEATTISKETAERIARQWIKENAASIFEEVSKSIGPKAVPSVGISEAEADEVMAASSELEPKND